MKKEFREALEDSPVIAAIKDDAGLEKCLNCDSRIIFILYGDVITIPKIVDRVRSAGKIAMVHIDLIQGLSSREVAVDFIHTYTSADGIISTRAPLIQRARELSMYTVMRFFLLDSMAFESIEKQLGHIRPDVVEVLPGPMPGIVKKICRLVSCPVIAGGLVSEKSDVLALLDAGASAISITKLFLSAGARDITLCDRRGAIYAGRADGMNWIKEEMAQVTNLDKHSGSLDRKSVV